MKKILTSMVLVLAFAVCSTSAFAGVLKWPYLIYPGQNGTMEVVWQDNATETANTICWGTDTTYGTCQTVPENNVTTYSTTTSTFTNAHQHTYTITGLADNTTYYYQVTADGTPADGVYGSGSFITAPSASATSVRFIGLGDTRSGPNNLDGVMQAMRNFYSQPGNGDYKRLVIQNGDWVSSDGESYWTSQWFDPLRTDIVNFTSSSPINGVKGNHDNTSGFSATFAKYFPFPYPTSLGANTVETTSTNPYCGGTASKPKASDSNGHCIDSSGNPYYNNLYWSFDYGPVHFTIVDEYSSYAPGSAQYNWLVGDLASTTKPWKILIYHEPAYSAGSDGDNTTVRALEPLITQYNVDLVYCGHSHNYARTGAYNLAQANGDQIALNVPHFTNGGGGAPIYQPDMTNTGSYPHVITAWPADEFMTFDVEGKTLTLTAYQVNGLAAYATDSGSSVNSFPLPVSTGLSPIETVVLNHFTPVTSQVNVTTTGFIYSRTSKQYVGSMTVTNNSTTPLTGNIDVVLDGLLNLQGIGNADNEYSTTTPKQTSKIAHNAAGGSNNPGAGLITNVTLNNATGSNNGEPMIRVSNSGLAAGASVTVPLQFNNPSNARITFNPITYQE